LKLRPDEGRIKKTIMRSERMAHLVTSFAPELPPPLTEVEILERLVKLNAERAAEEKRGIIHWLRPEYQIKAIGGGEAAAPSLDLREPEMPKTKSKKSKAAPSKQAWPKTLNDRFAAIEAALHRAPSSFSPDDLAKQFARAKPADVEEILETLTTIGRAHRKGSSYTK
jgi:hypothetical protein